jgi:hypothetical protein
MGMENDIMNKGQMKFMIKWSQTAGNGMEMINSWNKSINDGILRR